MKFYKILLLGMVVSSLSFITGCSDDETSSAATNGSSTSTSSNPSLGDSEPTGKIVANNGFFLLFNPGVPSVIDGTSGAYTQQSVTVTIFANDVNDLVEVNGQTVNFRTEWGQWLDERDSCVLENGSCSVTWRSGNPATVPGSCEVDLTAWTVGEESFADLNDNGLFDVTDGFIAGFDDLQEPFLDINGNGIYDVGVFNLEGKSELIDIPNFNGTGATGVHDNFNGLYDGSLCASGNALCNPNSTSLMIHTRSFIRLQATGGAGCGGNPG